MVHDVNVFAEAPGARPAPPCYATGLLGAFGCGAERLHIDLCRLAGAMCSPPRHATPAHP